MKDLEEIYGKGINRIEEKVLYGRKYMKITFEDGEAILRRWNDKAKLWVTLKFAKEEEPSFIEDLIEIIVKNLSSFY